MKFRLNETLDSRIRHSVSCLRPDLKKRWRRSGKMRIINNGTVWLAISGTLALSYWIEYPTKENGLAFWRNFGVWEILGDDDNELLDRLTVYIHQTHRENFQRWKPRYEHDCDTCQFLGTYSGFDLYYHAEPRETVIARWSDYGPDYTSGMTLSYGTHSALTEARRRAEMMGFRDV